MKRVRYNYPKRFKEILSYNRKTGIFTWVKPKRKPFLIGKRADRLTPKGYRTIKIEGTLINAARLAWWWCYGRIPKGKEIDHKNRKRGVNRINNLQLLTTSQNIRRQRVNRTNKLGIKHLSFHRASGLFRVRIIGQPVKYFKTKSAGYAHIVSKRITK